MSSLSDWRDASLILLCLEGFIIALPSLYISYKVVVSFQRGLNWLRAHFPIWQGFMVTVHDTVAVYCHLLLWPATVIATCATVIASAMSVLGPKQKKRSTYE